MGAIVGDSLRELHHMVRLLTQIDTVIPLDIIICSPPNTMSGVQSVEFSSIHG